MKSLTQLLKSINKAKVSKNEIVGHKTPPKKYKDEGATEKEHYADPENFKYPIYATDETTRKKRIRAAIAYFSKLKNNDIYKPEQRKQVAKKICDAAEKEGVDVNDDFKEMAGIEVEKKSFDGSGMLSLTERLIKSEKLKLTDDKIKEIAKIFIKKDMKRPYDWKEYQYDEDGRENYIYLTVDEFIESEFERMISRASSPYTDNDIFIKFFNLFDKIDDIKVFVTQVVYSNLNIIPQEVKESLKADSTNDNNTSQTTYFIKPA